MSSRRAGWRRRIGRNEAGEAWQSRLVELLDGRDETGEGALRNIVGRKTEFTGAYRCKMVSIPVYNTFISQSNSLDSPAVHRLAGDTDPCTNVPIKLSEVVV